MPAGAVDVIGPSATLAWTPAAGPVAGYAVFLARDGGAMGAQPETSTTAGTTEITVLGAIGGSVAVQVAAFDAAGVLGPLSPASELIHFVPPSSLAVRDALAPALEFAILTGPAGPVLRVTTPQGSVVAEVAVTPPAGLPPDRVADARAALCDVDGDGRDEVVLGFGSQSRGWLEVREGAELGFAPRRWLPVPWFWLYHGNGETRPACGDLDGDGRDELAVGFGPGSHGWLWVADDAVADFAPVETAYGSGWLQIPWPAYNASDGSANPACGDLDGDGRDELVVGLGPGGAGWMQALDDAGAQFQPVLTQYLDGWFYANWASYNAFDGSTYPGLADLEGDGLDEVVAALAPAGAGRAQVFARSDSEGLAPAVDLIPPDAWMELESTPGEGLTFDPHTTLMEGWLSFAEGPGAQP